MLSEYILKKAIFKELYTLYIRKYKSSDLGRLNRESNKRTERWFISHKVRVTELTEIIETILMQDRDNSVFRVRQVAWARELLSSSKITDVIAEKPQVPKKFTVG